MGTKPGFLLAAVDVAETLPNASRLALYNMLDRITDQKFHREAETVRKFARDLIDREANPVDPAAPREETR